MKKILAIFALMLIPGLALGVTSNGTGGGAWSANATWAGGIDPCDGDAVVIAAGDTVVLNKDLSSWVTGVAGLTITGSNGTPGMLEPNYATVGTYHIKIKTGTTINGSAAAVTNHGRILANSDGVWANTGQLPLNRKFVIELLTTAYIDAAHLDMNLRCKEPTNPTINLSADEAIGQTELSVATSVVGDTWADGDTVSICDLQKGQEHETRVIAAGGIAAGAITVTAGLTAAKTAGTYPAVMILCTRNIKIIGGSGASQVAISGLVGGTVNAWMYCATAAQGYALSACSNFTISGGYIGVGPTSGWATGWARGLSSCYGFTWSGGTSSGNTYGLYTCYGFRLSGCTLNNTTEMYRVAEGELYNCSLAGTENSQYNTTTVPVWNYIPSYDHDANDGQFRSWTMGGLVNSTTNTANIPTGFGRAYTHVCESATYQNFRQQRVEIEPGRTLRVTGWIKFSDDHSAWAPRIEIIDCSADPLVAVANTPLATDSVDTADGSVTTFQEVKCLYRNAGTLPMPVWIRVSAKRASGNVYEAFKSTTAQMFQ